MAQEVQRTFVVYHVQFWMSHDPWLSSCISPTPESTAVQVVQAAV